MSENGTLDLQATVVQVGELLSSEINDEVVLLDMAAEKYYGMNPVAARIWALLEQPRRLDRVCAHLLAEFEVERQACEQEVLEFVQELADARLVELRAE